MKEILKRLELIQHAIALEESDIVELQEKKLSTLEIDKDIQQILSLIREQKYGQVAILTEEYIGKFNGVLPYEDPAIQGLKAELSVLEKRINELSDDKTELSNLIHIFNIQYHDKLGDIIEQILRLKKERYEEAAKKDKKYEEPYQEVKEDYESFHQEHQEVIEQEPIIEIDEQDEKRLKILYREASKLCHPDIVTDEFNEKAEEIFVALNDAYQQNDLDKVEEILNQLKSGESYGVASDTIDNKELLEKRIKVARDKIHELEQEIKGIKESDTYQTIQDIDDWNAYFEELRSKLEDELESCSTV
jgi:DnaJ-domain-containing protein 1